MHLALVSSFSNVFHALLTTIIKEAIFENPSVLKVTINTYFQMLAVHVPHHPGFCQDARELTSTK